MWREYYTPILGERQVAYMWKNLQSAKAIAQQIQEGLVYYLILKDGEAAGYTAIKPLEGRLFLSKLYVLAPYRGQGAAKQWWSASRGADAPDGPFGDVPDGQQAQWRFDATIKKMGVCQGEREQVGRISAAAM